MHWDKKRRMKRSRFMPKKRRGNPKQLIRGFGCIYRHNRCRYSNLEYACSLSLKKNLLIRFIKNQIRFSFGYCCYKDEIFY